MTITVSPAAKRSAAASGQLSPLAADLAQHRRDLATALREVFDTLGMSLSQYALACHRDKGAVSRHLSGQRVPQRDFVDELLRMATQRPSVARAVDVDLIYDLHAMALATLDPQAARLLALEDDIRRRTNRNQELTREIEELRRKEARQGRQNNGRVKDAQEELRRRWREEVAARTAVEKELAAERAKNRTSAGDDTGILGCIL